MRSAVYAGTFDPVTLGHLSVATRAVELFDQLWIVIAHNPAKAPLFSVAERLDMLREVTASCSGRSVTSTDGYVVTLARELGARYLVRGVRGATDIESEIALARLNHGLAPEIETVFVPAHAELSEVSSSRLKQLAGEGANLTPFCPVSVAERLRARFNPSLAEVRHV